MKDINRLKQLPKKIALRLLIDNLDDNNDYILLLSQWNSNERDRKLGILSEENYRMYKARVEYGVNSYIEDLSEDDVRKVLAAAKLKQSEKEPSSQDTNTTHVTGDGNIIIQGVSDSKISVIKDSKNVVSDSNIKAGGDVHIGDVNIYGSKKSNLKNKKTILFLASNPLHQARLNLEKEHSIIAREIQDKSAYVVQADFAVSKIEMNEAVDDRQPTILHFSGHGSGQSSDDTGLLFHNDDKSDSEVLNTKESQIIFKGLKQLAPNLQIVVLNACYSEGQALAISKNGLYTIGTSNTIPDAAAIAFAKGFYRKYTQNENLEKAIRFGIIQANTTLKGQADANELIHLFFDGVEVGF